MGFPILSKLDPITVDGPVTATQFNGSGAGLANVPWSAMPAQPTDAGLVLWTAITPAAQRAALALGTSATRDVGSAAGTVCAGDDARLSDTRVPKAHTHTPGEAGAAAAVHAHAAADITDSTAAGRAVLKAADAAAQRAALGLGAMAQVPDAPNDGNPYVRKGQAWSQVASGGAQLQTVAVPANGNVTVPAWATAAEVTVWPGGGGGGEAGSKFSGYAGVPRHEVVAVTPGATISCTVGAGGGNASFAYSPGVTDGGSSAFGALVALGGRGATNAGGLDGWLGQPGRLESGTNSAAGGAPGQPGGSGWIQITWRSA